MKNVLLTFESSSLRNGESDCIWCALIMLLLLVINREVLGDQNMAFLGNTRVDVVRRTKMSKSCDFEVMMFWYRNILNVWSKCAGIHRREIELGEGE